MKVHLKTVQFAARVLGVGPDHGNWAAWPGDPDEVRDNPEEPDTSWTDAIRIAFGRTEDIAVSRWYALYGHEDEKHEHRGKPDMVRKEVVT